jgi:hypothetical protein
LGNPGFGRASDLVEGRAIRGHRSGAWVKNGVRYTEDAALLRVNSEGSKSLVEIRIAGAAGAIVFDDTANTVHYSATKR